MLLVAAGPLVAPLVPTPRLASVAPSPQPPSPAAPGAAASSAPAGTADLAGALRVLVRHKRLADAAELAAGHLQAALRSVPSVGMARASQVRPSTSLCRFSYLMRLRAVPRAGQACLPASCASAPAGCRAGPVLVWPLPRTQRPPPAAAPNLPAPQVYFPAALLDQLVAQLGAGGAGLAAERQQLADLVQRVRGTALAQTAVIQQLYAH